MKKLFTLACLPLIILVAGCGDNKAKTETKETATTEEKMDEKSNDGSTTQQQPATDKTSRYDQRRAKGDTLALPYKDLQAYLPEISGYTKDGGPRGSQMNVPGMGSWSETEQRYSGGDKSVSVKIMDYNSAFQAMQSLSMGYGMGFTSEDDNKKQAPADLGVKDVFAYETIHKTEKRQEMVIIVADRFIINLDANGESDPAFIRSVAKAMRLQDLATL